MRHWSKSPEHPDAEIETAWAAEAHRRWKAYQRGEEEMLPFEDVMTEIRKGFIKPLHDGTAGGYVITDPNLTRTYGTDRGPA